MALVSPGLEITVTDESQYISGAVGTVPLIFLATAQNKIANGSLATGTTASAAGQLQIFTSQRELVNALGYPVFKQTSAGTPIHGSETNEYGLMAAYSALGISNRLYAVRADIDLNELEGTFVRPVGEVDNNSYWFDLGSTTWGINEWRADTQEFVSRTPLIITDEDDTEPRPIDDDPALSQEDTPLSRIGQIGSYAVVATTSANRLFFKNRFSQWVAVGSRQWQRSLPTVTSSVALSQSDQTYDTVGGGLFINDVEIIIAPNDDIQLVVDKINNAFVSPNDNVTAFIDSNFRLVIAADSNAKSTGPSGNSDGLVVISGDAAPDLGLAPGTYAVPTVQFSNYSSVPSWDINAGSAFPPGLPRPSGSVWMKLGATGAGSNFVFKRYNSSTGQWTSQAANSYSSSTTAIFGLDPVGGGQNIAEGTIYMSYGFDTTLVSFVPNVRTVYGQTSFTTSTPPVSPLNQGDSFQVRVSTPGSSVTTSSLVTIGTVSSDPASDFVTALLSANLPNLFATVNSNGTITVTHNAGGVIAFVPNVGNPVQSVGLPEVINGFDTLSYTYSISEPFANPEDGTLWYYSDPTEIDIMFNDGNAWRGYKTGTDSRGYNLTNTDPMGVIVSASEPFTQTDNSPLVAGDLWLDTSDLENYPNISRWNGSDWIQIDTADQTSQNGIVFADARWGLGTDDVVTGNLPDVVDLASSSYVDPDAPDARLYPRGILLFNTRRSGYNVKRFVSDYFDAQNYTNLDEWDVDASYYTDELVVYADQIYKALDNVPSNEDNPSISVLWAPIALDTWVTASGNQANGAMYAGRHAQRAMIVEAIRSAVNSNDQIREERFEFNLILAPGYPEAISSLVGLNNDRANTAFVIGDTPMTLRGNGVDINNWSSGAVEGGLTTADPYMGVYWPSGLSTDVQGNPIVVPPSHMALRTYIRNDNVAYPWFAPAGLQRGIVDNATDLGWIDTATGEFVRTGVTRGMADILYSTNINPIVIKPGVGIVVNGQKTRNAFTSALDRVNVARLVNYIRTILARSGDRFLFEPNDKITRDQLKQTIERAMNDLVSKRAIYDYVVVCDTSNNTPERIARNEMYVDIAIEPVKSTEFIYVPLRLVNPGDLGNVAG